MTAVNLIDSMNKVSQSIKMYEGVQTVVGTFFLSKF